MWAFLLLLAVPLVEISLFVTVGAWLTLWPTLAIVVATGVAGILIIRQQGVKVLTGLQTEISAMRDPFSPLAHGALVVLAGVLLIAPGFFTDTLGLLLLIPATRRQLIRIIGQRIQAKVRRAGPSDADRTRPFGSGSWEDAEFEEIAPENEAFRPPSGWTRH